MEPITSFKDSNSFLSNFHPCEVHFEGMIFGSSEHAFQAAKTTDIEERHGIQDCSTPGQAKRAGRRVTLRPDWDAIKLDVMREIVRDKFKRNPDLWERLAQTENAELVEGNHWHDDFWGVCSCEGCSHVKGQNNLGKILMEIRAELCEPLKDTLHPEGL
jgi:ribA/ribD-fused uncharacterized protein